MGSRGLGGEGDGDGEGESERCRRASERIGGAPKAGVCEAVGAGEGVVAIVGIGVPAWGRGGRRGVTTGDGVTM